MMRILLLLLLLVCASLIVNGDEEDVYQCANNYRCEVLNYCDTGRKKHVKDKITTIDDSSLLNTTCPFMIRVHAYTKTWAVFILESLTNTTQLIAMENKKRKMLLRCSRSENGTRLEKGDAEMATSDIRYQSYPLKCTFTLKLHKTSNNMPVLFESDKLIIDQQKYQFGLSMAEIVVRCDPSLLKFSTKDEESSRVYKKIKYEAGVASCSSEKIAKIEFRAIGMTKFEDVNTFECVSKQFVINGVEKESEEPIEIRCYYDVNYFCNYAPETVEGKVPLETVLPVISPSIATKASAKCPTGNKYLMYNKKTFLREYSFNCVSEKDTTRGLWTLSFDNRTVPLRKGVATVYCTDRMECEPISERAVVAGTLEKFFPICFADGVMEVKNQNYENRSLYEVDPRGFECDHSIGMNKLYLPPGRTTFIEITKDHRFICTYPTIEQPEPSGGEFVSTVIISSTAITGGGLLAIAALAVISLVVVWYQTEKVRCRENAFAKAQWEVYGLQEYKKNREAREAREKKEAERITPYNLIFKKYMAPIDITKEEEKTLTGGCLKGRQRAEDDIPFGGYFRHDIQQKKDCDKNGSTKATRLPTPAASELIQTNFDSKIKCSIASELEFVDLNADVEEDEIDKEITTLLPKAHGKEPKKAVEKEE